MSRKEEKTAQIMEAATDELLAKGVDAASMHNIAELAGVSKRTLYKYFSNKEELYSALIDEILDQIKDMYSFEYHSGQTVKDQISKIIDSKIELTLNPYFLKINKIVIGELLKDRKPTDEQMVKMYESELTFVKWIDQAKVDDKVTSKLPSEEIAQQFHSILKGQIYWPVLLGFEDPKSLDLNKVRETTLSFFLSSFCL